MGAFLYSSQRRNKKYDKRKLLITLNDDKYYVSPYGGWYFINNMCTDEVRKFLRKIIFEDFYWLIGKDCDYDEWENHIEHLDKGKGVDGCCWNDSWFFEGEKEIALNSFYKTE